MDSNDLRKQPAPEHPDYARGLRTMPRDDDVEPDFARGERTRPRDPAIRPDFARGERTRPVG